MKVKKKLIEVALPLDAINRASDLEKQPFTRRHPRSLHIWWARRPLAAARAVIFAQLVDDPSGNPDLFPGEKAQDKERQRLFRIVEKLVRWESTNDKVVLQEARDEIWQSWRRACAENAAHARAKELFDRSRLPAFHDPFSGGGALPLEAQRLGLEAFASDLNPVSVLINKAMLEIPPKFVGRSPANPKSRADHASSGSWKGVAGLAEDIRYYGQWMRDEAEKRIGHLYPKVSITAQMAKERPDLKGYVGQDLTVIAWLWARTVRSPNPAFANVHVPLVSTFILSTKPGKEAYVEPVIEDGGYRFIVRVGKPKNIDEVKAGTKLGRGANFRCVMSGAPIAGDYIKSEGKAGRIEVRLLAIVGEGERSRVYVAPTNDHEMAAQNAKPDWRPDLEFFQQALGFRVGNYGMRKWSDLFTDRQLVVLTTLCDLALEARALVKGDAVASGLPDDDKLLEDGGNGATAYADAIGIYLSMATSRWSDMSNALCSWNNTNQNVRALFSRQAIPMNWDFVELSPFSSVGSWYSVVESAVESSASLPSSTRGYAVQADARRQSVSADKIVSTDPPYYDNIGYADLSDFFYVWLRRALRPIFPKLFATLEVPKADELVATPDRHGGRSAAEDFFLNGMTQAMQRLAHQAHPAFPVTIYYAFKQSEGDSSDGIANTGWETFLDAVISADFSITGTWPMRTEREARSRGIDSNALASSIVLVCRPRSMDVQRATRREFMAVLKRELPGALRNLQAGNIAPVDLAQAAIGPGMAVFTRYAKVMDAAGEPMKVREALALINEVLDAALSEQEGDFDADSRWALAWFEEHGFSEGDYGRAEQLSKSKNTSVAGMMEAGILLAKRGKARLLKPNELAVDWDPSSDSRLTAWESVHHLIRALNSGEQTAADLVGKLGSHAETARELAYRLYVLCERKKRATEALAYNGLVQSWPEIVRLAKEGKSSMDAAPQSELFEEE